MSAPAGCFEAARAKLDELCERWTGVHPRCRGLVYDEPRIDALGLSFRIENLPNSTREANFSRKTIEAMEPAAFAEQLELLYAGALTAYEPILSGLPREAP